MPRPTTTWQSLTSTKVSSTKRARPTKKRSNSIRTTHRSGRITSSSRKSMIGPVQAKRSRRLALAAAVITAMGIAACGADYYEIPIETPIQPKLDVSPFQRVLVAAFVAGGTEDVDANQETVRLLRSQIRTKSSLRVIDADILPLIDIAQDQNRTAHVEVIRDVALGGPSNDSQGQDRLSPGQTLQLPQRIKE